MPHLILEYSANISPLAIKSDFLKKLHLLLAEFETFKIEDMKSRAICHENFCLAEGSKERGFMHLQIAVMPGRPQELLKIVSDRMLEYLKNNFLNKESDLIHSFSVEFRELNKETYSKVTI